MSGNDDVKQLKALAKYEGMVDSLDFSDPMIHEGMINKIRKNLPDAKTVENFLEAYLKRDRALIELELLRALQRWFGINQQIDFVKEFIEKGGSVETTKTDSLIDR